MGRQGGLGRPLADVLGSGAPGDAPPQVTGRRPMAEFGSRLVADLAANESGMALVYSTLDSLVEQFDLTDAAVIVDEPGIGRQVFRSGRRRIDGGDLALLESEPGLYTDPPIAEGAIDPSLDTATLSGDQAAGMEEQLDGFFAACRSGRCSWSVGADPAAAFTALTERLRARPLVAADGTTVGVARADSSINQQVTQASDDLVSASKAVNAAMAEFTAARQQLPRAQANARVATATLTKARAAHRQAVTRAAAREAGESVPRNEAGRMTGRSRPCRRGDAPYGDRR